MQLSENFLLSEFLQSGVAARNDIKMEPSDEIIANLKQLCEAILQPLRDKIDTPIRITSGFRPPALNAMIGGSKTSSHMRGMAADIVVPGMTAMAVAEALEDMDLIYDQQILEYFLWTHVSISHRPRYERLTAIRQSGKTVYKKGFIVNA